MFHRSQSVIQVWNGLRASKWYSLCLNAASESRTGLVWASDLSLCGGDVTQRLAADVNPVSQSVHALLELDVRRQPPLVLQRCVCLQTPLHLTQLIQQLTTHLQTHDNRPLTSSSSDRALYEPARSICIYMATPASSALAKNCLCQVQIYYTFTLKTDWNYLIVEMQQGSCMSVGQNPEMSFSTEFQVNGSFEWLFGSSSRYFHALFYDIKYSSKPRVFLSFYSSCLLTSGSF